MKRVKVQSSMIESVGHDNNTLTIEFASGTVYEYDGVSEQQFLEFLKAPSLGKYFHENFKKLPNRRVG